MRKLHLAIFFSFLLPLIPMAQSSYQLGMLPSLNINKKLQKDWSLHFKAESRQGLINGDFNYEYLLTDISLIAATKIGISTTIAGGYLIRIDEGQINNRAIQQISFVKRYPGFRLSHRISSDQTFQRDDQTEVRLRYRLSSEIPLEGQSLDPGEFFLKMNNEYLNSFQGDEYDLELRLAAFLGYAFGSDNKLEIGVDYRVDSFIDNNPRNRFWISLNFYQTI
jgi:hypothetical protein